MSVVRCPSCGRVVDGDTCFACGHSLSDAPVAPASATEAAVAINPYSTGAPPAIARAERPVTPAPGMPLAPAPPAAASKSGAVRCPHCGRIAEGTTCMACGNEWGDDVNGEVAAPQVVEAAPVAEVTLELSRPPRVRSEASMATAAAPSPRTSSFQGAVDTPLGGDTLELGYGANEAGLLRTLWEGPIAYAIVAASSFLVVVIVGSLLFVKPDDALARIDRGEAAGVLKSLEKRGELSPAERLVQGHAYISLGQTEEALISYEEAGKSNVVDTRALEATLVALDDQVAETAIRVLTSWPGPGVDDALVVRARDPRALLRRNAIRVLDHRGKLTPETEEGAALLDIQGGKTCEERRAGLLTLGRVGRSKSALSAVEELDHGAANACLTADLTRVQRDVMTRVAATPAAPAPR